MQKFCYFDSIFVSYNVLLLLFSDDFNKMLIWASEDDEEVEKTSENKNTKFVVVDALF